MPRETISYDVAILDVVTTGRPDGGNTGTAHVPLSIKSDCLSYRTNCTPPLLGLTQLLFTLSSMLERK